MKGNARETHLLYLMVFLQDTIALIWCLATRELSDNMPPLYTDNTLVGGLHTNTVSAIMGNSAGWEKQDVVDDIDGNEG